MVSPASWLSVCEGGCNIALVITVLIEYLLGVLSLAVVSAAHQRPLEVHDVGSHQVQ